MPKPRQTLIKTDLPEFAHIFKDRNRGWGISGDYGFKYLWSDGEWYDAVTIDSFWVTEGEARKFLTEKFPGLEVREY
jgi:spermidine synthase